MRAPFYENVSSKYGAPMGRRSDLLQNFDYANRLHMRRVPMVDGDYDPGGAYWGGGRGVDTLWCVWDDEGNVHYSRGSAASVQAKFDRVAKDEGFSGAKWYRGKR